MQSQHAGNMFCGQSGDTGGNGWSPKGDKKGKNGWNNKGGKGEQGQYGKKGRGYPTFWPDGSWENMQQNDPTTSQHQGSACANGVQPTRDSLRNAISEYLEKKFGGNGATAFQGPKN